MTKAKWNFQTFRSGYAGDDSQEEPLLPTGIEEQEDSDVQSNTNQKEEPLYPIGIDPK